MILYLFFDNIWYPNYAGIESLKEKWTEEMVTEQHLLELLQWPEDFSL